MSDTIRRQHRFTITPEHLILDPRVSDRAFRLWCRLDRYAGENETAYPTRESLCIELDCSPASIDRATKELVDAGWLVKERRAMGDSNLYTMTVAPTKDVERLVKAARQARIDATQPRRDRARERRREQKRSANVNGSVAPLFPQVNKGGVVTSDATPIEGGVVTHDATPLITGDERGVITGDAQKEAPTEGSNKQGDSASSLRSDAGAAEAKGKQADKPAAVTLTSDEIETGRDADGKALRGKRLDALAQNVTTAWWEWIDQDGRSKPAQSFLACRGVIRAALGNGLDPKAIKSALAVLTKEGRAVSGATLQIAMQAQQQPRRRNDIDWDAAERRAQALTERLELGGAGNLTLRGEVR